MDEEYYRALRDVQKMAGEDGIDAVLQKYNLDALILPAEGKFAIGNIVYILNMLHLTDFSSRPPAMVGYPIITGTRRHHLDTRINHPRTS
jgi:amidase